MKNLLKAFPALFLLLNCVSSSESVGQIYIRFNQMGYLPSDQKSAIVLSKDQLKNTNYAIMDAAENKTIIEGSLILSAGEYASFDYTYKVDFSRLSNPGKYYFSINGFRSYTFSVGEKIFAPLVDSLLAFYKIQRCGYTNPVMHNVCHIADATSVIDVKAVLNKKTDLTGGWHDAGDYVKFLNTTAVTTYTLLFSYEFDPDKFGFDNNKNNIPDILEEAKVGLDWLLRCYYPSGKLVTQVQDLRDHDVGWRMPEQDALQYDRPAYLGLGKNLIGIYTAALALASKIWKEKINYPEFADKCLTAAEVAFSLRNKAPDVDSSGTGSYIDKVFEGKLALGAYELYSATGRREYLNQAFVLADRAGSDYWWSWGNMNAFVHYKLARFDKKYMTFIERNLNQFYNTSLKNIFELGADAAWGINNTLLGISLQNILLKKLNGSSRYDRLAVLQRDFILGRNPWGISFISRFGSNYVQNIHHQVAYLNGGKLTGGFAAGPAKKAFATDKIKYEKNDPYSGFQTDELYYRDDRMDYITNEPTIVANATAIFVFGFYSK